MFRNIKLAPKMLGAFGAVALLAEVVGGVGYFGIGSVAGTYSEVSGSRYPSAVALSKMSQGLNIVMVGDRGLINGAMSGDPALRKGLWDLIDKAVVTSPTAPTPRATRASTGP